MPAPAERPRRRVLGVEVDAITLAEAVDAIVGRAADPRSAPAYVVKPYVEFVDRAAADPEVAALLRGAFLSVADGVALQWAASYLARPRHRVGDLVGSLAGILARPESVTGEIPERAAGASFTRRLLERCARDGVSVHLVGSPRRGSIAATADHLRRMLPGLRVTGASDSRLGAAPAVALVEELRRQRPDVVLVGMGFPRQERLMARLAGELDHGVLIGEGGTFDYVEFGGSLRRAPGWMRSAGLEWLWRLALEPWRLRRQLAIPRFIVRVHRQARRGSPG